MAASYYGISIYNYPPKLNMMCMYFYTALRCNGHPDFCELRFDQVTFHGSHSSGSGFNGQLRNCEGIVGSQCLFRNHLLSITGQLDLRIRFLNLDVCHLSVNCSDEAYGDLNTSRLVSCQGGDNDMLFQGFKYGGRVIVIFNQVEDWMRNNTEEVIGLHFTRNTPSDERNEVFNGLVQLLDLMWGEQSSSTGLNSFYTTNNSWPTLKQAVKSNQRIFDEELIINETIMRSWINPPPFSTFQENPFNPSCLNPGILDHASNCNTTNNIVIAAGYIVALCITNAQVACNDILLDAMEMCFSIRREENRTVNVILVDYPEMATNNVSVFSVAIEMNMRNILNERSTEITSGERSTEITSGERSTEITSGERSTEGIRSTETAEITSGERSTGGERSTESEWSTEITPGERSSEGKRSTENTTGERSTETTPGEKSSEGERSTENTTGERSTETTPRERSSEGERSTENTPGKRSSEGERSIEIT